MELILEGDFYLERFSGKAGWTYIPFPKENITAKNPFGMLKVSGSIDEYQFENKHLMPVGDGRLFLPLAKQIRKKIKKEAGDSVHLKLYRQALFTAQIQKMRKRTESSNYWKNCTKTPQ